MTPRITYLDNAATTPLRPEVREAMLPFLGPAGNPSSTHQLGRAARGAVEEARRAIARAVGADPSQVLFTSGGTEADNLAIVGVALAARSRGGPVRIAVSAIEHKAVLDAAHFVEELGGEAVVLPVSATGVVDPEALDHALARGVALVSAMWVNNEVGIVQPVSHLAARCREGGVPFHTDAVQALGKVPVSMRDTDIGFLALSGHKIGAPPGVGALVVRHRRAIEPLLRGGGQQNGLRPGTENVPGIVALGTAVALAVAEQAETSRRLCELRTEFEQRLLAILPDAVIQGWHAERAPHISAVSVPGTDSATMLMHLDLAGIACSAGSACRSGDAAPSHVLAALAVSPELATSVLRFSFGQENTREDVDTVINALPHISTRVRALGTVLAR